MNIAIHCVVFSALFCQTLSNILDDPDYGWSPEEYIRHKGYSAEIHHVVTPDGYILSVFRVRNPKFTGRLQPVLLQHCLLCSAMVFLVGSPHGGTVRRKEINYDTGEVRIVEEVSSNLGFALADQGYDVWLPNVRGTSYSTNHTKYDPFKDDEFWNFSLQEMVQHDLPSCIAYIQKITQKREIGYVGHSQGTIIVLWLLAERPEYSKILNPVVLLAPILETKDFKDQIWVLLGNKVMTQGLMTSHGPAMTRSLLVEKFTSRVCTKEKEAGLCTNFLKTLGEFDSPQLNLTRLGVVAYYFPAGASRKQLAHYFQASDTETLMYFDEGPVGNMRRYNRSQPPQVPWERINSTTLAAFWSPDDSLATEAEVTVFKGKIKVKLMDSYRVPYDLFSHMDFVLGLQTGRLVNDRIVRTMNGYFRRNQADYPVRYPAQIFLRQPIPSIGYT